MLKSENVIKTTATILSWSTLHILSEDRIIQFYQFKPISLPCRILWRSSIQHQIKVTKFETKIWNNETHTKEKKEYAYIS